MNKDDEFRRARKQQLALRTLGDLAQAAKDVTASHDELRLELDEVRDGGDS